VVSYLEQSVHEVSPRASKRVFHPKVWLLRYADEAGSRRFRFLCLSRNLTFDRSWDTVLQLEGTPSDEIVDDNDPLVRFLRALPRLAVNAVPLGRRRELERLADELRHVRFKPPAGFRELRFWPLGLAKSPASPFEGLDGCPKLIVSPFLSEKSVTKLTGGGEDILVSRSESLDGINPAVLTAFGDALVLDSNAQGDSEEDGEPQTQREEVAEAAGGTLQGLHAKLYIFEHRASAHLFTGSANATTAAFNGNVEFLVELRGDRNVCGIRAILDGAGGTPFRSLLEPYASAAAAVAETEDERLERELDELRRRLAACGFQARATRTTTDGFELTLSATTPAELSESTHATCWPLSLPPARALPLTKTWHNGATFAVSEQALTSFFVIELSLAEGRRRKMVRFIVNAKLTGAPADRLDRLLVQLLQTRGDVLRYLLFLLADEGSSELQRLIGGDTTPPASEPGEDAPIDLPLFESLVRALARSPERLDNVARLVASLTATAEGRERLPEEFEAIWKPIWQARTEARSR
jgi:hypothetical protein